MNTYEFLLKLIQSFINDKILVIIAVTGLTGAAILKMPNDATTIVTSAFTGLFGIAVGRAMARSGDQQNPTNGGAK